MAWEALLHLRMAWAVCRWVVHHLLLAVILSAVTAPPLLLLPRNSHRLNMGLLLSHLVVKILLLDMVLLLPVRLNLLLVKTRMVRHNKFLQHRIRMEALQAHHLNKHLPRLHQRRILMAPLRHLVATTLLVLTVLLPRPHLKLLPRPKLQDTDNRLPKVPHPLLKLSMGNPLNSKVGLRLPVILSVDMELLLRPQMILLEGMVPRLLSNKILTGLLLPRANLVDTEILLVDSPQLNKAHWWFLKLKATLTACLHHLSNNRRHHLLLSTPSPYSTRLLPLHQRLLLLLSRKLWSQLSLLNSNTTNNLLLQPVVAICGAILALMLLPNNNSKSSCKPHPSTRKKRRTAGNFLLVENTMTLVSLHRRLVSCSSSLRN
mmetsp:Transcript_44505/g.128673  ORF Transcript_44505/g.128673 Transcript_44505/m.128673 type:complete len:374 (-) Transcript_44505:842-1963(-)